MRVNHRRFDTLVTQQLLQRADVTFAVHQLRRKRMAVISRWPQAVGLSELASV